MEPPSELTLPSFKMEKVKGLLLAQRSRTRTRAFWVGGFLGSVYFVSPDEPADKFSLCASSSEAGLSPRMSASPGRVPTSHPSRGSVSMSQGLRIYTPFLHATLPSSASQKPQGEDISSEGALPFLFSPLSRDWAPGMALALRERSPPARLPFHLRPSSSSCRLDSMFVSK